MSQDSRDELEALWRARRLLDICDAALLLQPDLRMHFVMNASRDDNDLRREALSLLDVMDALGNFLQPADDGNAAE